MPPPGFEAFLNAISANPAAELSRDFGGGSAN